MDVTTALPKVPTQNLHRKPRAEFGRVWAEAEQRLTEVAPTEYYVVGVVITFRWVARQPRRSPVTDRIIGPEPENLDAEYMAALRASHDPQLHPRRAAKARGAAAVLGWLGHGGPEPLAGVPLQRKNPTQRHG
ncbi:MAG: hypothetical protein ACREX8_02450 [Gammaproteobacteria bacterium]